MDAQKLIREYQQGIRDFHGADLYGADLYGADLTGADLSGADFRDANLTGANLSGADLSGADFRDANLTGANLSGADLGGVYLRDANLNGANLTGACLIGADLRYTDFHNADLRNTCLDPDAQLPDFDASEFEMDSDDEHFFAYRTERSMHIDERLYKVGVEYAAPVFSVADTSCHPGLYFATLEYIKETYAYINVVKVRIALKDAFRAGYKYRCRRFTVIAEL